MKIKISILALIISTFLSATMFAQKNPSEKVLKTQVEDAKKILVLIDSTISKGTDKGKFSVEVSDSLYSVQDYIMDLNDRLYWATNKDSIFNAVTTNAGDPANSGDDSGDENEIPMPDNSTDSTDTPQTPDFDWKSLMKPKVKKTAKFVQFQNGIVGVMHSHNDAATGPMPAFKTNTAANQGGGFIYARRIGKADVSNLKMEFNIKKKLTTSNFIKASPTQFRAGIFLQRYEMKEKGNIELNENNGAAFSNNTGNITKNIITAYQINVPITIWRKISKSTFIEAGGFVGILRKSTQTYSFEESKIKNTLIRRGDLGLTEINYGATAAIGYGPIAIYTNYHLSPLFANRDDLKYNLWSVGLKFGY